MINIQGMKKAKEEKKLAKEREWADTNEQVKYVNAGGKVQCPFHPAPADIIVTSNTVMLQDKPFATVADCDGKVNFNFTGVCMHPSQQKPFSPPPPCKAVISLGKWKDFSQTIIQNDNALLVKSTIVCNISGQDLKIIDSGQKAELTDIKPKMEKIPKIIDAYWKRDNSDKKLYVEIPGEKVTLYLETEDYELGQEAIAIFIPDDVSAMYIGNRKELKVKGVVGLNGIVTIPDFIIEYE